MDQLNHASIKSIELRIRTKVLYLTVLLFRRFLLVLHGMKVFYRSNVFLLLCLKVKFCIGAMNGSFCAASLGKMLPYVTLFEWISPRKTIKAILKSRKRRIEEINSLVIIMHLIHVRITLAYKHAVHTKTHVIRRPLFCVIMQQMYVSKSSLLLITYYYTFIIS